MKIILMSLMLSLFSCSGMDEDILSPTQQQDLKSEWESKSPQEKSELRAYQAKFRKLPLSEREDLKDRWKQLSPQQKQKFINRAKSFKTESERQAEVDKFFSMSNKERLDYLEK